MNYVQRWFIIYLMTPYAAVAWYPDNVNISNLVFQYASVCGSYWMCNDTINFRNKNITIPKTKMEEECRSCSCDPLCVRDGTCCVDVFPNTCENIQFPFDGTQSEIRYVMISDCPVNTSIALRELCQSGPTPSDFLNAYPVTSTASSFTYLNKYCAECNNDTSTVSWNFDVDCPSNFDINIYSTAVDIWNDLNRLDCVLAYIPLNSLLHPARCIELYNIASCNVTGSWTTFDADIKWACENIYAPYRMFRNVFCYLCNSGTDVINETIISTCNSTGVLKTFDPQLTENCMKMPLDAKTFPYKNKYCQSCNIETTAEGYIVLKDVVLESVTENISFGNQLMTLYSIKYLNDLSSIISNALNSNINETNSENGTEAKTYEYIDLQNISNLFINSYRYSMKMCNNQSFYNTTDQSHVVDCSCDVSCISDGGCCLDNAISYPIDCVQTRVGETNDVNDDIYVLIAKCPKTYSYGFIKTRCETMDKPDIYSMIPVYFSPSMVSFKNIYCFLCNTEEDIYNETLTYSETLQFWYIDITCRSFYDLKNFPSLQMSIDFSIRRNCTIRFMPRTYAKRCGGYEGVQTCNKTGIVATVDRDVNNLCEHFPHNILPNAINPLFSNIFCEVCNNINIGDPVAMCNLSGSVLPYSNITEMLCETSEATEGLFPYKNAFCFECNQFPSPGHGDPQAGYRKLFAISDIDDLVSHMETSQPLKQEHCPNGQVYDPYQDICRELFCSPGKYLKDGKCIPLITVTSNLQYNIGFEIQKSMQESPRRDIELTIASSKRLDWFLKVHLDLEVASTDVYYVMYNLPCWSEKTNTNYSKYISNDFEFKLYYYLRITTPSYYDVNRYLLERRLYNLTSDTITVSIESQSKPSGKVSIRPRKHVRPWLLPSQKGERLKENQCHISYNSAYIGAGGMLYSADVTDLLLCPQLELQPTEFSSADDEFTIHVTKINRKFQFHEYLRYLDGTVRICLSEYVSREEDMTSLQFALMVFTNTCTCVSLLCLLATFIIYVIFTSLRTLPGMNMMGLVFSLFLAQFTYLLGYIASGNIFCITIGICIHYFWLTTFSFTNVCSFHMFRVFAITSLIQHDLGEDMRTFTRYCMFACLFPMLFIALNLILHNSIISTDGFGYGGVNCFLEDKYALIYTFIIPFTVQMFANIVFFAVTFHKLKHRPCVESTKKDQTNLFIYMKLFLITGITWLLQLIDGLFPISLFSFLVSFLNACQGLFIFLSYVCTKRVYVLLRGYSTRASFKSVSSFHTYTETHSTPCNGRMMSRKTCINDGADTSIDTRL